MHPNKNFKKRTDSEVNTVSQPFSLQAEQAIIGAILFDPKVILDELAEKIVDDHFYDPFCRAVYKKALAMSKDRETVDIVVLSARLDGVIPGMEEIAIKEHLQAIYMAYPSRQNLQGWTLMLVERWVERQLSAVGNHLLDVAHRNESSIADKLAEAHRMLGKVGNIMAEDSIISTEEMVAETLAEIEANATSGGQVSGIPTGLAELDAITTGLKPGDLIILAARPSMGKTSLALSLAKHVSFELPLSKRKRVLMFSMEMGKTQIGMRWLSVLYDVPMQDMRTGTIGPVQYGRLQSALEDSTHAQFDLEESGTITMEQLAAKARRLHRDQGLGMIVIDYLQLISDSGNKNANKSERVGEISRALKQLAKELKVPIVALSQLSRALEARQDKRPMMSDLRDSGAIEQDADIIIFLYRDCVYNKNTQDPDEAEIIIAKHRNGPTGIVKSIFEKSTTRFHDGRGRLGMGKNE